MQVIWLVQTQSLVVADSVLIHNVFCILSSCDVLQCLNSLLWRLLPQICLQASIFLYKIVAGMPLCCCNFHNKLQQYTAFDGTLNAQAYSLFLHIYNQMASISISTNPCKSQERCYELWILKSDVVLWALKKASLPPIDHEQWQPLTQWVQCSTNAQWWPVPEYHILPVVAEWPGPNLSTN